MVYLLYAALAACLFFGAKVENKGQWNEKALSYAQTKSFLGFCALIIILHHCSQRTCAPWLPPGRIVHGLDAFLYLGYLCVAAFFFCSGFGMYTASRERESFFKGYHRRILALLLPAVVMWLVFFGVEKSKGVRVDPPIWINTFDYAWYVPAMIYLYLLFYLAFHLIKDERAGVPVLIAGTLVYFCLCLLFSPGTWWYNTHHLFAAGVITARHRERIQACFRKRYLLWLPLSLLITAAGFMASYYFQVLTIRAYGYQAPAHFIAELAGQVISSVSFVVFVMLVGRKVRIGNRLLSFLGGFTLEIYLVHPLFVQLFGFAFMNDAVKPLYYIRNPFLYAAAVAFISIPLAFLLHRMIRTISGTGSRWRNRSSPSQWRAEPSDSSGNPPADGRYPISMS